MKIRRLLINFTEPLGERDPFVSNLLTSLSLTFPAGEEYFKRSVRAFQSPLKSDDVKVFLAQESHHSRVHKAFNALLGARGYPVDEFHQSLDDALKTVSKTLTPLMNLSATCAFEHITATLAEWLLTNPKHLDDLGGNEAKRMWIWHALEELEHKSVAIDLYRDAGGSEFVRVVTFPIVLIAMAMLVVPVQISSLRLEDASLRDWVRGARGALFGHGKIFDRFVKMFGYMRPSFHPHDNDTSKIVEKYDVW